MASAFRILFIITVFLTLITLPIISIGFFPITLLLIGLSIIFYILWRLTRPKNLPTNADLNETHTLVGGGLVGWLILRLARKFKARRH